MRMRKIPWAEEYLKTSPSLVQDPLLWKNHLPQQGTGKLHLEIGAGKGAFSRDMAKKFPQDLFLAMEKNVSAAALAAKLYDQEPLNNLALMHQDASGLSQWFQPDEISVIHLNFSDPWPKKRNHKRRLSAPSFLEDYHRLLNENGEIILKSDNRGFFNDSVVQLLDYGFRLKEIDVDYHVEENEEDVPTEYELKFRAQEKPIYYAKFENFAKGINEPEEHRGE